MSRRRKLAITAERLGSTIAAVHHRRENSSSDPALGVMVGYVGPLPPLRGGIAQHGSRILDALEAAGAGVVAESWKHQFPTLLYRRPQIDPTASQRPDTARNLSWRSPLSWHRAGRSMRSVDRLVMPWTHPIVTGSYHTIRHASSCPISLMVHNAVPHERFPAAEFLARGVLRRADRLVCHSTTVAEQCRQLAPGVPVVVVPHPADIPVERTPMPGGRVRLLAPGYIRPYKGTDLAVRAVAIARKRGIDIELTVAGEPWGDEGALLRKLTDDLGEADSIRLDLRYLSNSELTEQISAHHAVIAPYRSATQSGVVAQAQAAGRPVIVTPVGGLTEAVTDGVNGVVASDTGPESIADAIERLTDHLGDLAAGAARVDHKWSDVASALVPEVG